MSSSGFKRRRPDGDAQRFSRFDRRPTGQRVYPEGQYDAVPQPSPSTPHRSVVVVLEQCGLHLGKTGIIDAYDRSSSTAIHNQSLLWARPDIVHQCLLALFDSDLAYHRRLRVYLHLTPSGRVVEVSPTLRPPRTLARFKGLMATLLRDGRVQARPNPAFPARRCETLLQVLPGTLAPIVPLGAPCVGLSNHPSLPIATTTTLAQEAVASPMDNNAFQEGLKNVFAYYCVSCTEDGAGVRPEGTSSTLSEVDIVSRAVSPSAYPMAPHVMCARLCHGFESVLKL